MALLHGALTRSVIDAFHASYDQLRYGFLESVYSLALAEELRQRGHHVAREVMVDVQYKGRTIATQRLDLLVDNVLILEVKAGERLHESAYRQLRSYLRATDLELGLVLNYGPQPTFKRVIFSNAYKRLHPEGETKRGDR
jgi:GxxExxY protein